ncbi:hypothetical protein RJT34_02646 [Clitoria ternatea]|uniref:Uncharacterized protein n=1 Tax=Clitoria ternatea TaxID=43366 RepID=A0AAN9Q1T5_CLITE
MFAINMGWLMLRFLWWCATSLILLDIGAVYLWPYVYNIMRISTRRIQIEDNASHDSNKLKALGEIPDSLLDNFLDSTKDVMDGAYTILLPDSESEEKASFSNKIKYHLRKISSNLNFKALYAPSTLGAV